MGREIDWTLKSDEHSGKFGGKRGSTLKCDFCLKAVPLTLA